jgi:uncharacterized protein YhaN
MNSTLNLKQTDQHDVPTARTDEALVEVYEQIKRANEKLSPREPDAVPPPSDPLIPVDTLRAALRDRRALSRPIGLALTAFISVVVITLLLSYGAATKSIIVRWVAQLVPMSSKLPATPAPTTQDIATTVAPVLSELAQLRQVILRDLANVEQGIEQLKTSQAQMARDNAQVAEQLKTSQAQMARDIAQIAEQARASQEQMASVIAKASGHDMGPKTPPTRPIATSTSKPAQAPPSPQSTTRPQAPSPLRAQKP